MGGGELGYHGDRVVGLSVFRSCEEFMEGVEDGDSHVAEAFGGAEACESRAVDGADVAGGFGGGVVGSGNCRVLLL